MQETNVMKNDDFVKNLLNENLIVIQSFTYFFTYCGRIILLTVRITTLKL